MGGGGGRFVVMGRLGMVAAGHPAVWDLSLISPRGLLCFFCFTTVSLSFVSFYKLSFLLKKLEEKETN